MTMSEFAQSMSELWWWMSPAARAGVISGTVLGLLLPFAKAHQKKRDREKLAAAIAAAIVLNKELYRETNNKTL